MNKEFLIELVDKGFSVREMIPYTEKSYSTIRYWLKEFNLKTKRTELKRIDGNKKLCIACELEKNLEYFYKSGNKLQTYCKKCSNLYHQNRVKDVKIKMINYKGGKCEDCNLKLENSHYSVYEFHHLDPSTKDPNFDKIKFQKWEKIKNEIDKCRLMCANCHRMEEAKLGGWGNSKRIVEIKKDKILNFCECGEEITKTSKRCKKCYEIEVFSKNRIKAIDRPKLETLLKDVRELGYCGTGRKYNVADNTIRKWIKNYKVF